MKKILCLLLAAILCMSVMTGCKKPDESESTATTQTISKPNKKPAIQDSDTTSATSSVAVTVPDATESIVVEGSTGASVVPTEEAAVSPTKATFNGTVATKTPAKATVETSGNSSTATKAPSTQVTPTTTKAPAATKTPTAQTTPASTKAPVVQTTPASTKVPTAQTTPVSTKAPTVQTTTTPVVQPTVPVDDVHWDDDNTLKILTIGNSFSVDSMQYVYQIAKAAGVENIKLGNLYIGSCSLSTHLSKAKGDSRSYTYYTNSNGEWSSVKSHKMSAAIISEDWDFVSFQQASRDSGVADTYDDLQALMAIVEPLCTNPNVKFAWHMTWAYQSDSSHDGFATYNKNQMTMYNAIVSAVQNKVVTNNKIDIIIPNGTAVQNARTSYVGDSLTRDGHHMSYDQGRKLTGVGMVAALIGIDWNTIDLSSVIQDQTFRQVAMESVRNAIQNPYTVTQSAYRNLVDAIDLTKYEKKEIVLYKNQYWQSAQTTELTGKSGTKDKYFATEKFTKETLPIGSIIVIADGWKYRPEAWKGDKLNTSSTRPGEVSSAIVEVTETWWGEWTSRGFNITRKNGTSLTGYTNSQIHEVFAIYIPKK